MCACVSRTVLPPTERAFARVLARSDFATEEDLPGVARDAPAIGARATACATLAIVQS
jgi:hypothetical protein